MKTHSIALAIIFAVSAISLLTPGRGRDGLVMQLTQSQAGESRLTAHEVSQLVAAHNAARKEVGTPPLIWWGGLALYAQEWADHLASIRRIEHRPHSGKWKQLYGENLFMGTAGRYRAADAVASWNAEKSAYRGEPIDMSRFYAYGHYTQVVWRGTRYFGCGKAEFGGNMIIVCNYYPAGNVTGQTPY